VTRQRPCAGHDEIQFLRIGALCGKQASPTVRLFYHYTGQHLTTMPLLSRILYTIVALGMPLGAHLADFSKTHIFNARWPPHAKFHTGQTLIMSLLLGVMTIFFAWRKTADLTSSVIAASAFAALYWVSQGLAILYPGTAASDPEFGPPKRIAGQYYFEVVFLALIALAAWIALRRGAQ
jgi:hypothetical protein